MNDEMRDFLAVLIGVGGGGGITALVSMFLSSRKESRDAKRADISEIIAGWQRIAEENDRDYKETRQELIAANTRISDLERYISQLSILLARLAPDMDLPPLPPRCGG